MTQALSSTRHAYRSIGVIERLQAGLAPLHPEMAIAKVMSSTEALLALPDERLATVRSDLELTASRIAKRLEAMENRR